MTVLSQSPRAEISPNEVISENSHSHKMASPLSETINQICKSVILRIPQTRQPKATPKDEFIDSLPF